MDETRFRSSNKTHIGQKRLLIWHLRAYSSVWVPKIVDRVKELSKADWLRVCLRHCVYSRYASSKNAATTCVCIGQESLGHSIVRLGQAVDDQLVAHRSEMDL